jgi:hypothetical protein
MKKIYFLLFISIAFNGFSQVILTLKDYQSLGTEIISAKIKDTANLNNFKYSTLGINNFWDFSGLTLNYDDTLRVISPNQTPYGNIFFDADRASQYGNNVDYFTYYKGDTNGYYLVGDISFFMPCPFSQPLKFKKPTLLIKFPASYPAIHFDTSYYRTVNNLNNSRDTAYCARYIYSKSAIVASGTIKLPFGAFESFLLKVETNVIDTTWIKSKDGEWTYEINSIPGGGVAYYWYCNKSTVSVVSLIPSGNNTIDLMSVQMNNYANLKSISINDIEPTKINIYPNPASSKLFVENLNLKNSSYVITDISGREIKKDNLSAEINIEYLQKGLYIICLYTNNEQKGRLKFVKQ